MEQSMTSKPDALLPSAKEVMEKIALAEAEEGERQAQMLAKAEAEKKALIDQLSKPSGISDKEAIRRGITIIERAMKNRRGLSLPQPAVHGQGASHQSAGARLGKDAHRRAERNLSTVEKVLSAAGLQAESTDRGFSWRFAG
jgi:hypothetical protein